jgi:carboxypeptidase Taq
MKIRNPEIKKILSNYQEIWSLNYLGNLVSWDTETTMPAMGNKARGQVRSMIEHEVQKKYLDPQFVKQIKSANDYQDLNMYEKGILRVLNLSLHYYQKIPQKFVRDKAELVQKMSLIWAKARHDRNFKSLQPFLKRLFAMTKQEADYLGYQDEPYDAIFNYYEDNITTKDLVNYFTELKSVLKELNLKKVNGGHSHVFKKAPYKFEAMQELNYKVLNFLGYDPERFVMAKSVHPFSLFLTGDDLRLTTRYPQNDFATALLPTIHEFGHCLYAAQSDPELVQTPIWEESGFSYAIHESLSRFWENMLGRSLGFIKAFYPEIIKLNPNFQKYQPEDLYQYLNHIHPSLIRVDADEATYHFHIIIRFELERALLNGEIKFEAAEDFWNEKYYEYLGIEPRDSAEGILQDIHWSLGSIGYFPTYSLGSTLSAVWLAKLIKDTGFDADKKFTPATVTMINNWFKDNVHKFAGTLTLKDVYKAECKQKSAVSYWADYIHAKFPGNFDKS